MQIRVWSSRDSTSLFCDLHFLSSGLSLQEELSLERGQSGYPSSCSRAGLGRAARHRGAGKLKSRIELKKWRFNIFWWFLGLCTGRHSVQVWEHRQGHSHPHRQTGDIPKDSSRNLLDPCGFGSLAVVLCLLLTDRGGHPTLPPVRRAVVVPPGSHQVQARVESLGGLPSWPGLLAGSVSHVTLPCPLPVSVFVLDSCFPFSRLLAVSVTDH